MQISILIYLRLLETFFIQIYIFEVKLKTETKALCVKCPLYSQILIKIVIKSVVGHCSNNFTKKIFSSLHDDRRGEDNMGITTTFHFAQLIISVLAFQ